MRAHQLVTLALLHALAAVPAAAQETVISQVDLHNGGSLFGQVIETGDRVRLVVDGDTVDLPGSQVKRVREVRGTMIDGRFMRADANETRLFFGPTARTLPAGDIYLGIFELYLPFVAAGITDRITLAGGMPLIFAEDMPLIIYLAPKIQLLRAGNLTGSVGSLSFFVPDEGNAGVFYGVMTAEASDGSSSLTAGAGWGYAEGEVTNSPVLMLGGDVRVSRSLKLMTENYFVPELDDGALFAFGIRFLGDRLSADVGLAVPSGFEIALPLVNFVYSF